MKFLYLVIFILGIMALFANRGAHRTLMNNAIAAEALRDAENHPVDLKVNLLRVYATLPEEQRAIVERVCLPVHQDYVALAGSSASLPAGRAPGCQAIFRAGWSPAWNIQQNL